MIEETPHDQTGTPQGAGPEGHPSRAPTAGANDAAAAAQSPAQDPWEASRRHESLRCALTATEVSARAKEAATKMSEHDALETEKKETAKAMKIELDRLADIIRRLLGEVRTQTTMRDVEVLDRPNFDTGEVETVRLDTGEVERSRPMRESERQMSLSGSNTPPVRKASRRKKAPGKKK